MRERLLLQLSIGVGGFVPVLAGAAGVFYGSQLVDATLNMAADSHFRYLSGLLFGIGIGFWSTIPRIEIKGARFRLLTFVVFVGGFARLISVIAIGTPSIEMMAALVMELGVTPFLCWWQWRISRCAFNSIPAARNIGGKPSTAQDGVRSY